MKKILKITKYIIFLIPLFLLSNMDGQKMDFDFNLIKKAAADIPIESYDGSDSDSDGSDGSSSDSGGVGVDGVSGDSGVA